MLIVFYYSIFSIVPRKTTGCCGPNPLPARAGVLGSMLTRTSLFCSENLQTMVSEPNASSTNRPVISSVFSSVQVYCEATFMVGCKMV